MLRAVSLAVLVLALVAGDQAAKFYVLQNLTTGHPRPVIAGFFDLHLVMNPGAAFGIFASLPDTYRRIALAGVSTVAILVVINLLLSSKEDRWAQLGMTMILGGAFGNLIDRFRFDSVVDFLDFYLGEHHWPAFNLADSYISIGVVLFALRVLLTRQGPVGGEHKAAAGQSPSSAIDGSGQS